MTVLGVLFGIIFGVVGILTTDTYFRHFPQNQILAEPIAHAQYMDSRQYVDCAAILNAPRDARLVTNYVFEEKVWDRTMCGR